ncbi:MAG: carbohydrate ABC transporter permease [Nitrososphaeria archaeon]
MIETKVSTYLFPLILSIVLVFFIYPIYLIFSLAFQPDASIFSYPPKFIFTPSLENFIFVIGSYKFTNYLMNSVIVTTCSVILSVIIGLPSTYVMSRYDVKGKQIIFSAILLIRFLPTIAIAIPIYLIYAQIGLYDTLLGLILVYVLLNLPFVVLLMSGYLVDVPKDLEETFEVDGLSKTSVFFKVTLPLISKGLLVTALFCLIFTWNEFAVALLLTGKDARTLTGQIASSMGFSPGMFCASGLIVALPMIIFGLLIRRYLIRGLSLNMVK